MGGGKDIVGEGERVDVGGVGWGGRGDGQQPPQSTAAAS